jgi:ketosteroid isomerase-like protein
MRLSNPADARSVPRTYGSDIDQRLRRAEMETKSGSITRESVEVVRRFVEALARENLARGKESGVETDARIAHLYTVEGEKITRLRVYDDRDEAQQAAEREAELQGEHQGGILRVAPRGSKEA